MNSDTLQYQVADEVLARTLGDALVLFHPETERLLTLNACGARIWELLAEETRAARIVARLTEEFQGPAAVIEQQTLEFLAQLEGEQIIRREE